MNTKQSLRRSLRQTRRSLTPAQQQRSAVRLNQQLMRAQWFKSSLTIGFYWPADGEISPMLLLRTCWRMGKLAYLPVIKGNSLIFRSYKCGDRLYVNRYGIPEPASHRPAITLDQLDLVLVPLVGFDALGHRLGMGAGFYDRCFNRAGNRPWRIGIAHDFQKIAQVPQDPWDQPLHAVVTDQRCYRFR